MPGDRPIWAKDPELSELSQMLNELVFWSKNDGEAQEDNGAEDSDVEPGKRKKGRKPGDVQG